MRRLAVALICCFGCGLAWLNYAKAQGRGGADWMTSNGGCATFILGQDGREDFQRVHAETWLPVPVEDEAQEPA